MLRRRRGGKFEAALAARLGAERAAAIVRELGPEISSHPKLNRHADQMALAMEFKAVARGPAASPQEIAAAFVADLRELGALD